MVACTYVRLYAPAIGVRPSTVDHRGYMLESLDRRLYGAWRTTRIKKTYVSFLVADSVGCGAYARTPYRRLHWRLMPYHIDSHLTTLAQACRPPGAHTGERLATRRTHHRALCKPPLSRELTGPAMLLKIKI